MPIIRALLFSNFNFYDWISGAWLDILTVLVIFFLGYISWYRYTYHIDDNYVHLKKGVLLVRYRRIPLEQLSIICVEHNILLKPFKAVRITIDTDAGKMLHSDFSITIRKNELDSLTNDIILEHFDTKGVARVYTPKNIYIAVLSALSSNSITGLIFIYAFLSGVRNIVGNELEKIILTQVTTMAKIVIVGLPPLFAILIFILLGSAAISFCMNLIRHLKFRVKRQGELITVKSGIITNRIYYIIADKINFLEIRQTLLTKLFQLNTVFIHCNGYGKKKNEQALIMPCATNSDMISTVKMLLGEHRINASAFKSKLKFLSRFIITPVNMTLGVLVTLIVSYNLFKGFSNIILFSGIMLLFLCLWYLFVKLVAYKHTGIYIGKDSYTLRYSYGYRFKTVIFKKNKLTSVTIRRSLFQVVSGGCDVIFYTRAEQKKRHVVPNIIYSQELIDALM